MSRPSPRPSPRLRLARLFLVAAALSSASCGSSPAVRSAEQGRFEGMREALAARVAQGALSPGEAKDLAHAVIRGEIARAEGETGARHLRDFLPCAKEVDGPLGDRAGKRDSLGAAAALVLLDAGAVSPGRYERYASAPPDAPEAAWRALGARALDGRSDGPLRRQLIADADEEVRRSALHAASSAADPEDVEVVLEAARVDPYPAARVQAIRAAGVLGGPRAVTALKDLWPRADAELREAIVQAWGTRQTFNSGGHHQLDWVVGTQHGKVAVEAAGILIREDAGAGEAAGALERAIKDGPTADRIHAIEVAPFAIPAMREAIAKAEADPDEAVAAAALGRRLLAPGSEGGAGKDAAARDAIVAKLLPIASGTGTGAVVARTALARARVAQVVPILERNGTAKDAATRIEAGKDLATAGELPRAAVVAADLEPGVRSAVACAMLLPR